MSKSNSELARNIRWTSIAILISRILGLVREVMMAFFFGATWVADAFNLAFTIPNLLRSLFGEGQLTAAFLPIYSDIGVKQGRAKQINFALNVLWLLTMLLTLLSLLGMLFAPQLVRLIAPGFQGEVYDLTWKLTRLLFPFLLLIGVSSLLGPILNAHGHYFIPGLASALFNIGMLGLLGGFYLLYPAEDSETYVWVFSYGVLVGGVLQTIINFPLLYKTGYRFRVILKLSGEAMSSLFKRFIPGVVGVGIRQINLLVDRILASLLIEGSISALTYANRLMYLPFSLVGVATGTVAIAHFSRHAAEGDWKTLSEKLRFAVFMLIYVMLPVSVVLIVLGQDILRLLFLRGAFDARALEMTRTALVYYALGLVFISLHRVIVTVFYANKDTKTPVKVSVFIVSLNIVLNLLLMRLMQHAGLALATSICSCAQVVIFVVLIRRMIPGVSLPGIGNTVLKSVTVAAVLTGALLLLEPLYRPESMGGTAIKLAGLLFISTGIVAGGGIILHIEYVDLFWKKLLRR
ncbi:MAG: murein biosynthesis integral membrane protein MurJ [Candidatus Cloacimonetes bacterium]|nr:murein biosynthesis integral membrane protein MurJ [Candidatus Cloacimonadota bacterium]